MQKDFLTITPDSGRGSQAVTVQAEANYEDARLSTITIQGRCGIHKRKGS